MNVILTSALPESSEVAFQLLPMPFTPTGTRLRLFIGLASCFATLIYHK